MKLHYIFILATLLAIGCSKSDTATPVNPAPDIANLITEGNGWVIEKKHKTKNKFLDNRYMNSVSLSNYNNMFYETFHTQWSIGTEEDIFRKIENSTATIFEFGPNFNYSYLEREKAGFFNLPNSTDQYYYSTRNNGSFEMFKNNSLIYSISPGDEVYPRTLIYTHSINPKLDYQINFDPLNWVMTATKLSTGKKTRFKSSAFSNFANYQFGQNGGDYVWDESYTSSSGKFKAYYASFVNFGNYNMHLNISEICDTISNIVGDPQSSGHYMITKTDDTIFVSSLAGVGFNFGDGRVSGFEKGNSVYFLVHLKNMSDPMRLYEYNKTTHQLSLTHSWASSGAITQGYTKVFYRPIHNDIIVYMPNGLHKVDLASYSITNISPTISSQLYSICQVGERIYGSIARMEDAQNFITNLFYYE